MKIGELPWLGDLHGETSGSRRRRSRKTETETTIEYRGNCRCRCRGPDRYRAESIYARTSARFALPRLGTRGIRNRIARSNFPSRTDGSASELPIVSNPVCVRFHEIRTKRTRRFVNRTRTAETKPLSTLLFSVAPLTDFARVATYVDCSQLKIMTGRGRHPRKRRTNAHAPFSSRFGRTLLAKSSNRIGTVTNARD